MAEEEAEGRKRSVVKPLAAAVGLLGTMASIWWFALKPRRKTEQVSSPSEPLAGNSSGNEGGSVGNEASVADGGSTTEDASVAGDGGKSTSESSEEA